MYMTLKTDGIDCHMWIFKIWNKKFIFEFMAELIF